MKFGKVEGFVLMGGGKFMREYEKYLKSQNHKHIVITSERYMSENDAYSADINKNEAFLGLGKSNALGIGFGEDYTFTQETIDAFQGRLVDYMAIPLPKYRGGAHWTWAMLNKETFWGHCIQQITPEMKQGEFDNGKILMQEKFGIPIVRKPQHLIDFVAMKSLDFLKRFTQKVLNNEDFELEDIDESQSVYYPRLDTMRDAQIDWSWWFEDVERFAKAFDDPYPGAWSYINNERWPPDKPYNEKVHLKEVESMEKTISHPFQNGLIYKVDKYIWVYGNGGILRIGWCSAQVKPGDRFLTKNNS